MIKKIKDWFLWLSTASIKRDIERLLQLAEEYKCSYNYSEIDNLKKQLDKEKNIRDADGRALLLSELNKLEFR